MRKTLIVALARKLLIALWRLVLLSQKAAVSAPVESVFVEIHIGLGAEMNHRRTDESESRFAGYDVPTTPSAPP